MYFLQRHIQLMLRVTLYLSSTLYNITHFCLVGCSEYFDSSLLLTGNRLLKLRLQECLPLGYCISKVDFLPFELGHVSWQYQGYQDTIICVEQPS